MSCFLFQAEDGIRDIGVTGVQTCALPILGVPAVDAGLGQRLVQQPPGRADERLALAVLLVTGLLADEHDPGGLRPLAEDRRSEESRVGNECRSRWATDY